MDDYHPRLAGAARGVLIHDALLHPDDFRALADGLLDDIRGAFGASEDDDHVHRLGHNLERRVGLLPEHGLFAWVDRDHAVAVLLHIGRDAVARPCKL